jgi:mersacidin/lichenicidin family type 2 lantibiotic
MSTYDIIRAWKDEDFRDSLSETERAALPQHPAGQIELSDEELEVVAGGLVPSVKASYCLPPNVCRQN